MCFLGDGICCVMSCFNRNCKNKIRLGLMGFLLRQKEREETNRAGKQTGQGERYRSFCLRDDPHLSKGKTKSLQIFPSPLLRKALRFSAARSVNASCQAGIPEGKRDFSLSSLASNTAQEPRAFCHFQSL